MPDKLLIGLLESVLEVKTLCLSKFYLYVIAAQFELPFFELWLRFIRQKLSYSISPPPDKVDEASLEVVLCIERSVVTDFKHVFFH